MGFPGGSDGKESAYNVGDLGLIPGSGRSSGDGIGYPLQYSWVSLVAQMVKNLPAMRESWVLSLVSGLDPAYCSEGGRFPRAATETVCVLSLSVIVQLFAAPWTVAH